MSSQTLTITAASNTLTVELDRYQVGWREKELGPFRPKSPTKSHLKSSLDTWPEKRVRPQSPNSLVYSMNGPPRSASPTKDMIQRVPSPAKQQEIAMALDSPGSVINMNQFRSIKDFSEYTVGWNQEELRGTPTKGIRGESLVVTDAIPLHQPIPVTPILRSIVKTDSFTISETGQITYN